MTKESKLAMLPWWPADYLSATRSFTLAERGAYTDMLFYSWLGDLPADPSRLARMLGVSAEELKAVLPALKGKFRARPDNPEFIVNPRLEQERIKSQELRAKAAEKASKAGKASWESPKRPARSKAPSNAPSTEDSSDVLELERLKADYPPGAQREDWIEASKYATGIVSSGRGTWDQLDEGVRRYRAHIQRTSSYVMNPAKFFSASDQPWKQSWGFGPNARASAAPLNGQGPKP